LSKELKQDHPAKAPLIGVGLALAGCLLLISPLGKGVPGQYGYAPGQTPPAVQAALDKYNSDPTNSATTVETARILINQGRGSGNADIVVKADTMLSALSGRENMAEALKLRAISQQYLHNFDEALKLLDLSLALKGDDATALLTRANILLVQGKIKEAQLACRHLGAAKRLDLLLLCETTAKALGPEADSMAARLNTVITSGRMDPALTGYAYSVLGEMAMFQGDNDLAEDQLEKAQSADPENLRIRMLHADSLLEIDEPEAAVKAMDVPAQTDAFLLRRAIAYKRSGQAEALSRVSNEMDRRIRTNARINHIGHAREEARYFLKVKNDPTKALERAKINWQVQREYEDAWIYIEAAKAAGKPKEADVVREWMSVQGVEASGLVKRLPPLK